MSKDNWDSQRLVSVTIKILLFIASLGLLFVGTCLAMEDKTASSTVTYTAGFICLFFVFLNEFSKFKGFGLEAELREKIREADEALQQLRNVSLPISEMLFTMAGRFGRLGSPIPRQDRYRIMQEIEAELVKLGVSQVEIDRSKHDWHRFNMRDEGHAIYTKICKKLDARVQEVDERVKAFPQPISDLTTWNQLAEERAARSRDLETLMQILQSSDWLEVPKKYEEFINNCPALSDIDRQELFNELEQELDDVRYYAKNHTFRRLEHWKAGN